MLDRLREHWLSLKKEKCEFCMEEIKFLRHQVGKGEVRIDESKVQTIVN